MPLDPAEERLQTLEEKLAWLEHLVMTLDGVVRSQGDELERMKLELGRMKEREEARERAALEAGAPLDPGEAGVAYEVPPHY